MKIQCNVCEMAEAKLLCCADEAALCLACDEKIHAANKLASKHQRVSLSTSSSQMPKCDICQETVGYFFCLEDRALLCRNCDVAIHTSNNLVSAHQRFLLTGVKLGLEADGSSSLSGKSMSTEKIVEPDRPLVRNSSSVSTESQSMSAEKIVEPDRPLFRNSSSVSTDSQYNKQLPMQLGGIGDLLPTRMPLAGGSGTGSIPQWQFDEYLGLIDGNQYLNYMENASSKAEAGKLGDSDSSAILGTCEEELDGDDYLGQVPDISFTVPEIPSPPTASGLCWSKAYQNPSDSTLFVPDISSSPMQNLYGYQPQGRSLTRQRQF